MQILNEQEGRTDSINDDNSSRKMKDALTEHNDQGTEGGKPKQAIKIQYGKEREGKKKGR